MNIFKKIWKSIYGPEFYADLKNKGTSFSVGYYVKLILLVSIISTVLISVTAIPLSRVFLSDSSINSFVELYPADLNVNIKNGIASTNVSEPYKIPLPLVGNIGRVDRDDQKLENAVVIDTKVTAISLESFKQYNTAFLLIKDSAVVMQDGGLQIIPLGSMGKAELNINRQTIRGFSNSIVPIIKKLVWLIPVFAYVGCFVANLLKLVLFFIFALLVWLILFLFKKDGGYMHAYRVAIHSMTLAIILSSFTGIGWLISVLLAVIVILINFLKKDEVISPANNSNTTVTS